jgi:ATP-binding cassette subfamily B multidrug efflux pump
LIFVLIGILISLLINIGWIGIFFFLYACFIIIVFYFLLKPMRYYYEQVREKYKHLSSFLAEYLKAIPLLRFYQVKDKAFSALHDLNMDKYTYEKKASILNYGSSAFLYFLSYHGVGLAVTIYLGMGFIANGKMTLGDLLVILQYLRRFFMPLIHFSQEILSLQSALVSLKRVYKYLGLKPTIKGGDKKLELGNKGVEIEFQKVWFAYEKEEWILKGVSFKVKPYQKIGLVGSSGAGKSTVFKLLLRFYDIQKGTILINGIDIREYDLISLRSVFSLITQESNLFYGTVKENITMLDSSKTEEDIRAAIKKLDLEEEFQKFCPDVNKLISEGGSNFSSGQRQLLAFLRAMLFERTIFLLDEATAFVDVHTEMLLQKALFKAIEKRTLLLIAHRLSTVKNMDKILVFSEGKLVEEGKHSELVEKKGIYYKLLQLEKKKSAIN